MTPQEIKQRREGMGLTRAQLAEALGMSVRGLQKWESGEREAARGSNILERALRDLERELEQERRAQARAARRSARQPA